MKTLYLMCGFSFSGKSTLAREIIRALPCAYISLDDINAERGLWGGDGISVEEWERTHGLARERLATSMATGRDAIVDDVNNFRWLRDRWRAAAIAGGYRTVVIYLDIPRTELIARRRTNQVIVERKSITDTVWAQHLRQFEPPGADESVLRYGLEDDAAAWIARHFSRVEASSADT